MPSIVAYKRTKNQAMLYAIGEDAERVRNIDGYIVVEDIKRFLEIKDGAPPDFPFQKYTWWNKEKRCLELWGNTLEVEDVIREIVNEGLKRAIRRAREQGLLPPEPMKKISLIFQGWPMRFGCAATAGLDTRQVLYNIAHKLGFAELKFEDIREEPVLASLPYLNREFSPGDILLVYDFGGGTFSAAVSRIDQVGDDKIPKITVLATDGEPFCGGTDIDNKLAEYLAIKIAKKYFNGERNKIPNELLEKEARDAKEILSIQNEHTIFMPPDFLNTPGIQVGVTRTELETVIADSRVLSKTEYCVLRAWQKARMVYRETKETPGEYYLNFDSKSGVESKFVTQLKFDDLNCKVNHVLLVGGTTKIPFIRARLAELLDNAKFITERDPSEPIIACSLGAASQKEHISSIIDRLPFSIFIKQGDIRKKLYQAYSPTVGYSVYKIKPFISDSYFTISDASPGDIECITPDGVNVIPPQPCYASSGKYIFEINCYGCFSLKPISSGSQVKFDNPAQHELQKAEWAKYINELDLKMKEEDDRKKKIWNKKAGEDHNLEVG